MHNELSVVANQPMYVYGVPMFLNTVSVVIVIENGVLLIKEGDIYRFPGGIVRAHRDTVHMAAVRLVKEQTGISLLRNALLPVDFRSEPERSKEGNVVDFGLLCILEKEVKNGCIWKEADFENKCVVDGKSMKWYMDHEKLLEHALEVASIMK